MELSGKNALVTGGAIRLGRALTLALARAGCNVVIHFGRSARDADATRAEAVALGVKAVLLQSDLSDAAQAADVVPAACGLIGPLHILVNSAALFTEGSLETTTAEEWEKEFAVNLRAPFLLCQAFARQIPAGEKGRILNFVDARIFRPGTDHFAYRLTKGALADMTRNLALELAPRITVNALALGAILPPPGKDQDHLERLIPRIPLRRGGSPEMVADNALHLIRQDFVTGQVLGLDGGEFL